MNRVRHDILFCPGPVNVAANVWRAIEKSIGHREEEFCNLLAEINEKLLRVYEIKSKNKYYPLIITGSGTAANETVLSSIVGDKHILVLINGEFGERLFNISRLHNNNTHKLVFDWGEQIDIEKVEKFLKRNQIDIIAMVHHETSTGMINPVMEIGILAHKMKAQFFVDTVSSAPLEKIELEKWHVTFCSTSSGKAISSLPGLGIIIGERKILESLKDKQKKIIYLNLYNLYHYSNTLQQTPNTPAVHLFYALDQALTNILDIGVETWRKNIRERAIMLRAGMRRLGLLFFIEEQDMSSVLTTVISPKNINIDMLKSRLKERRIVIYGGKGPLLNKVFQVANIGEITRNDINYFLHSLKSVLFDHDSRSGKDNYIVGSSSLQLSSRLLSQKK